MTAQNKDAPSQGSAKGTGPGRAGTTSKPSPPLDEPQKASLPADCALRPEVLGPPLHFRGLCLVTHHISPWVWALQPCGRHKASVSSRVVLQGRANSDPHDGTVVFDSLSVAFAVTIIHSGLPQRILPLCLTVKLNCLCSEPCPPVDGRKEIINTSPE